MRMPPPFRAAAAALLCTAAAAAAPAPPTPTTPPEARFDVHLSGVAALQHLHVHPPAAPPAANATVGGLPVAAHAALRALDVHEGDLLIGANDAAIPALPLQAWLEALSKGGGRGGGGAGVFPLVEVTAGGEGGGGGGGARMRVTGFLKAEVIPLQHARAVFRPAGKHRQELEAAANKQASAAAAQLKAEQERIRAQAQAIADAKQRELEEETRKRREAQEKAEREKADAHAKAAAKAAAAASAAAAARTAQEKRARGEGFVYTVEFKEAGPMGITFDLANTTAVIGDVARGSAAATLGIRAGDQLVEVNGVDTSGMGPERAGREVMRSEWPRKLSLAVLEVEKPASPRDMELVILEPLLVRGVYALRAPNDWGADLPLAAVDNDSDGGDGDSSGGAVCSGVSVLVTDPDSGCATVQQAVSLVGGNFTAQSDLSGGAVVIVRRGSCPFIDKASNVQTLLGGAAATAAGARSAVVVANTDNELVDMPAGNLPTAGITIPVAMMRKEDSFGLEQVLGVGMPCTGLLAAPGRCAAPPLPRPERGADGKPVRNRPATDVGGRLAVVSARGAREFDWHLALYGPHAPNGTVVNVVVASPSDACDAEALMVRVRGSFVIAERGVCSFSMKTLALQKAGALGMILTNNAATTLRMMAPEEEAKQARIPSAMASSALGAWAEAHARLGGVALARFFYEDYYGAYG